MAVIWTQVLASLLRGQQSTWSWDIGRVSFVGRRGILVAACAHSAGSSSPCLLPCLRLQAYRDVGPADNAFQASLRALAEYVSFLRCCE